MTSHAPDATTAPPLAAFRWPEDDAVLAAALADGAATVLRALHEDVDAGRFTGDAKALKDAGDAAAQAWLAEALAAARPTDSVLSEEARDDARRLDADRVWIIDPLDGTREFSERASDGAAWRTDFAVHVALWTRDAGLAAAAVSLPARNLVLRADAPPPMDSVAEAAAAILRGDRPLRLAVSRSRPPGVAARLGARPDVDPVPMGSVGVKVLALLDGVADAYVHAGGQYEWDQAAPVAVAQAAGCIATRLDGSPLDFNKPDPWSPDLVVCHPALVAHLHRLLAEAGADDEHGAA